MIIVKKMWIFICFLVIVTVVVSCKSSSRTSLINFDFPKSPMNSTYNYNNQVFFSTGDKLWDISVEKIVSKSVEFCGEVLFFDPVTREVFLKVCDYENYANVLSLFLVDNKYVDIKPLQSTVLPQIFCFTITSSPRGNMYLEETNRSVSFLVANTIGQWKETIDLSIQFADDYQESKYLIISALPAIKSPLRVIKVDSVDDGSRFTENVLFPLKKIYLFAYLDKDGSDSLSDGDLFWQSDSISPCGEVVIEFNSASFVSENIFADEVQGFWVNNYESLSVVSNNVLLVRDSGNKESQSFEIIEYNSKNNFLIIKHLLSFDSEDSLDIDNLKTYYQKVSWEKSYFDKDRMLFKFSKEKSSLRKARWALTNNRRIFQKKYVTESMK